MEVKKLTQAKDYQEIKNYDGDWTINSKAIRGSIGWWKAAN
jgi:hypothetical protein